MVTRKGDGEFTKEAAHNIAHEQERDEYGDQGDGERYDGETDLLRTLQRGLKRRLTVLYEPRDVFDHHDCVVHHKAGGDGQGHERQIVQAVAEQVHHAEGADQRQGHGDTGHGGGRQVAQEEEDDHDHERHRQHELELHVAHGSANRVGAIGEDAHLDGGR